jgi:hypothetical protein
MLAFTEWTDLEMDFTSYHSSSYGDFPGTGLPGNRACALTNCYLPLSCSKEQNLGKEHRKGI